MSHAPAAILCALLLKACAPDTPRSPAPTAAAPSAVASRTVAMGSASCVQGERRSRAFTEAASWQAWLREMSCGGDVKADAVDFEREGVLAVDGEDATNGCHALRIVRVERTGEGVVVHVERYVPAADAICAAVMGHPFHAVAVDRSLAAGAVSFSWSTVIGRPAP